MQRCDSFLWNRIVELRQEHVINQHLSCRWARKATREAKHTWSNEKKKKTKKKTNLPKCYIFVESPYSDVTITLKKCIENKLTYACRKKRNSVIHDCCTFVMSNFAILREVENSVNKIIDDSIFRSYRKSILGVKSKISQHTKTKKGNWNLQIISFPILVYLFH